jgi:hypothetical protein
MPKGIYPRSMESNQKRSNTMKGKNTWMQGTHPSKETLQKMSKATSGKNNPAWKGGKKLAIARMNHTRRTLFSFIPLNKPREDGWVAHHIEYNYVIYIPEELHKRIRHSQKNQESMNKINDAVYDWFVKYYLKGD